MDSVATAHCHQTRDLSTQPVNYAGLAGEIVLGPVAALPVPYRTTKEEPTFFCVRAPGADVRAFPVDLPACLCGRSEIQHFAEACKEMGIQYVGICCGNSSHYLRIVADVYGRNPPAKRYAPEMSKHYIFGDKAKFTNYYTDKIKSHIAGTAD